MKYKSEHYQHIMDVKADIDRSISLQPIIAKLGYHTAETLKTFTPFGEGSVQRLLFETLKSFADSSTTGKPYFENQHEAKLLIANKIKEKLESPKYEHLFSDKDALNLIEHAIQTLFLESSRQRISQHDLFQVEYNYTFDTNNKQLNITPYSMFKGLKVIDNNNVTVEFKDGNKELFLEFVSLLKSEHNVDLYKTFIINDKDDSKELSFKPSKFQGDCGFTIESGQISFHFESPFAKSLFILKLNINVQTNDQNVHFTLSANDPIILPNVKDYNEIVSILNSKDSATDYEDGSIKKFLHESAKLYSNKMKAKETTELSYEDRFSFIEAMQEVYKSKEFSESEQLNNSSEALEMLNKAVAFIPAVKPKLHSDVSLADYLVYQNKYVVKFENGKLKSESYSPLQKIEYNGKQIKFTFKDGHKDEILQRIKLLAKLSDNNFTDIITEVESSNFILINWSRGKGTLGSFVNPFNDLGINFGDKNLKKLFIKLFGLNKEEHLMKGGVGQEKAVYFNPFALSSNPSKTIEFDSQFVHPSHKIVAEIANNSNTFVTAPSPAKVDKLVVVKDAETGIPEIVRVKEKSAEIKPEEKEVKPVDDQVVIIEKTPGEVKIERAKEQEVVEKPLKKIEPVKNDNITITKQLQSNGIEYVNGKLKIVFKTIEDKEKFINCIVSSGNKTNVLDLFISDVEENFLIIKPVDMIRGPGVLVYDDNKVTITFRNESDKLFFKKALRIPDEDIVNGNNFNSNVLELNNLSTGRYITLPDELNYSPHVLPSELEKTKQNLFSPLKEIKLNENGQIMLIFKPGERDKFLTKLGPESDKSYKEMFVITGRNSDYMLVKVSKDPIIVYNADTDSYIKTFDTGSYIGLNKDIGINFENPDLRARFINELGLKPEYIQLPQKGQEKAIYFELSVLNAYQSIIFEKPGALQLEPSTEFNIETATMHTNEYHGNIVKDPYQQDDIDLIGHGNG